MNKLNQLLRLFFAVVRHEPSGHIQDLWDELRGKVVLCGKPPNQYLMRTDT